MKLQQLAAEPKLEKITIDHEDIVKKYGEELDFYMYDRQDMGTFMEMASLDQKDQSAIFNLIKKLVRDEEGNLILTDSSTLPIDVMIKMIEKVVTRLGNSQSQIMEE